MSASAGVPGTLYLLHFDHTYGAGRHGTARHYLGWALDAEARLAEHLAGRGSPLVAAVVAAGIGVELVATWPGDRHEERRRKRAHRLARSCPRCGPIVRGEEAAYTAARRRARLARAT